MDLKIYYEKIIDEIKSLDFKIIEISDTVPKKISPHLEAINYIIYDWNRDHKDDRDLEFEYIIQPKTDIDMNDVSFDNFFNFIIKTKTNENVLIDTKDIEIIKEDIKTEYKDVDINQDVDMDFWNSDEEFKVKKRS